jgi:hypothetical protein
MVDVDQSGDRAAVLHTIVLDRGANGTQLEATIYFGLSGRNLDDIRRQWKRAFRARLQELGEVDEDRHWRWRVKYELRQSNELTPCFVLEVGTSTEGLLYLVIGSHFCRLTEQAGFPLVYVDLVATAPWNRPHPNGIGQRYAGVGRALLAYAVLHSRALGFEGRIGLHSLPGAEAFYAKMFMTGPMDDPEKGLRYFETTPANANNLLLAAGVEIRT